MNTGSDVKTLEVTNSVASIHFTGAMNIDCQHSSDEETVEAVNFVSEIVVNKQPLKQSLFFGDDSHDLIDSIFHIWLKPGENIPVDSQLGLRENHFSFAEDECASQCSVEDLQRAIDKYKVIARHVAPKTDEGKTIIRRLVQLRLKLLEAKENAEQEAYHGRDVKKCIILGHNFERRAWSSAKGYCERCNGVIVSVLQPWCQCTYCGYCCHRRCMNHITRTCVLTKVTENPVLSVVICPEKGLHAQNYRCAECRASIGYQPGLREPRLCDYSGLYFCNYCHWNDTMLIPARIIANWDFQPRKISRVTKQYLKLMLRKPVLHIQNLNPMLFRYLEELNDVKHRRQEVLIMKQYFLKCPGALSSKLLCQLSHRQHFVDNADMYSLQDLIDLANDVLLPELTRIHASFAQHIKTDCSTCQSTGCQCQLCDSDEMLFPFDSFAFACPDCSTVYHRHCYMTSQNKNKCVVCIRRLVT